MLTQWRGERLAGALRSREEPRGQISVRLSSRDLWVERGGGAIWLVSRWAWLQSSSLTQSTSFMGNDRQTACLMWWPHWAATSHPKSIVLQSLTCSISTQGQWQSPAASTMAYLCVVSIAKLTCKCEINYLLHLSSARRWLHLAYRAIA